MARPGSFGRDGPTKGNSMYVFGIRSQALRFELLSEVGVCRMRVGLGGQPSGEAGAMGRCPR